MLRVQSVVSLVIGLHLVLVALVNLILLNVLADPGGLLGRVLFAGISLVINF